MQVIPSNVLSHARVWERARNVWAKECGASVVSGESKWGAGGMRRDGW
jgi:hypothetical protein